MLEELSHLMELSISQQDALTRFEGPDALGDRIAEWFETPMWTVADLPSWGHNLGDFVHEPISVNLEVMMEARIIKKLSADCGVPISGIRIDILDIDKCRVRILYQGGIFDSEVDRNALQR